jgi:hypothetical protein
MRPIQRLATAILIASLAGPSLAAGPARLQTGAQAAPSLIAAAEQLRQRLKDAGPGAEPPMLTNSGAPLIRAAFDLDYVRHMPLDTQTVGQTCMAIGSTIVAYAEYAQRSVGGAAKPGAADAGILQVQNELSLAAAAANICVQRGFRSVLALAEGMPATQRSRLAPALKQMRDGAVQTLRGSLDAMLDPGLRADNQAMLLSAIVEDVDAVAASFPAAERAAFRQQILDRLPRAAPALRDRWNKLAAAFAGTACNTLCEIAKP